MSINISLNKILFLIAGSILLLGCLSVAALAQTPPRQPTPNDTLISPEVATDRRVTFRIYAPKATDVALRGDWMEGPGTI